MESKKARNNKYRYFLIYLFSVFSFTNFPTAIYSNILHFIYHRLRKPQRQHLNDSFINVSRVSSRLFAVYLKKASRAELRLLNYGEHRALLAVQFNKNYGEAAAINFSPFDVTPVIHSAGKKNRIEGTERDVFRCCNQLYARDTTRSKSRTSFGYCIDVAEK